MYFWLTRELDVYRSILGPNVATVLDEGIRRSGGRVVHDTLIYVAM